MKIDFNTLSELAESVDGSPRANYSGRGMYGRNCVGIVMSDSNLLALGATIAELDDQELSARLLSGYSTDSMGYDTILYWTGVTCEDSPEDSDDWEAW